MQNEANLIVTIKECMWHATNGVGRRAKLLVVPQATAGEVAWRIVVGVPMW